MRRRGAVWAVSTVVLLLAGCGSTQGGEAVTAENGGPPESDEPVVAEAPRERQAAPRAGRAWVVFGTDTVVAEVARTADERAEGLMYREEVPDGAGMLFVFPDSDIRSFWMSNTYVALDIAYLDAGFTVVDIQQMEPQSTDPHESAAPAMFALEVRQGWFEEHGVRVGSTARVEFGAVGGR